MRLFRTGKFSNLISTASIFTGFFFLSACENTTSSLEQLGSKTGSNASTGIQNLNPQTGNSDTNPVPEVTPTPSSIPTPIPTPSPSSTPVGKVYTGPDVVDKYVQKFISDGQSVGVNVLPDMKSPTLQVQIASLSTYGSTVIGLCERSGNQRRVTLAPTYWNSVSDSQKELLVHHELGHCVLYRPHRTDLLSNGKYASIMYPVIMSSSTYTADTTYYLSELFTWSAAEMPSDNESTIDICDVDDLSFSF